MNKELSELDKRIADERSLIKALVSEVENEGAHKRRVEWLRGRIKKYQADLEKVLTAHERAPHLLDNARRNLEKLLEAKKMVAHRAKINKMLKTAEEIKKLQKEMETGE